MFDDKQIKLILIIILTITQNLDYHKLYLLLNFFSIYSVFKLLICMSLEWNQKAYDNVWRVLIIPLNNVTMILVDQG